MLARINAAQSGWVTHADEDQAMYCFNEQAHLIAKLNDS